MWPDFLDRALARAARDAEETRLQVRAEQAEAEARRLLDEREHLDDALDRQHIEKNRALGELIDVRDRATRAEAAIARVRELHSPVERGGVVICDACSPLHDGGIRRYVLVGHPCDTIRALDDPAAVSEEQTGGGDG